MLGVSAARQAQQSFHPHPRPHALQARIGTTVVLCPPRAGSGVVPTHPPEAHLLPSPPAKSCLQRGLLDPPPRREPGTDSPRVCGEPGPGQRKSKPGVTPECAGRPARPSPGTGGKAARHRQAAAGSERDLRAPGPESAGACGGLRRPPTRSRDLPGQAARAPAGLLGLRLGAARTAPCSRPARWTPAGCGQAVRRAALSRRPWRQRWGRGGRRGSCWRRCGAGAGASQPR